MMAGLTGGSGGTRGPGRPAGAGAGNVEEEGNFKCELCNRRFKSHHALSVHFATSAAHKVLLRKFPITLFVDSSEAHSESVRCSLRYEQLGCARDLRQATSFLYRSGPSFDCKNVRR